MTGIYNQIREFCDRQPCGTSHIREPAGSREYFVEFDKHYESLYPYLLPFLDVESMKGKWVLEIGLGSGFTIARSSQRARVSIGLDISGEPLKLNRARNLHFKLRIGLVQASATRLPIPDNTFDTVVSIGCLHHIPDIKSAIAEIHLVLKPDVVFRGMIYNRNSYRFRVHVPIVRRLSPGWKGKNWQS